MRSLKETIDKSVAAVSIKSGEFVEITKCKTRIGNLERQMEEHKTALGAVALRQWKEGERNQDELDEICVILSQTEQEIAELQENISKLQNANRQLLGSQEEVICQCGISNRAGVKFCYACGRKLQEAEPQEERKICVCGAEVRKAAKFCPACGHRFAEEEREVWGEEQ